MPNASWRRRGVASARGGGSPTLATERSGSGKGGAKRRAAQAKRGSLGKPLAGARGGAPLPCLLSMVRRKGSRPLHLNGRRCFFFASYGIGNRATFSDSRSNFHTRIGYRTNVCRRRFASDLARASEVTPAQGALEDHHDRLPGSPPIDQRSFVLLADSGAAIAESSSPGRWPR